MHKMDHRADLMTMAQLGIVCKTQKIKCFFYKTTDVNRKLRKETIHKPGLACIE